MANGTHFRQDPTTFNHSLKLMSSAFITACSKTGKRLTKDAISIFYSILRRNGLTHYPINFLKKLGRPEHLSAHSLSLTAGQEGIKREVWAWEVFPCSLGFRHTGRRLSASLRQRTDIVGPMPEIRFPVERLEMLRKTVSRSSGTRRFQIVDRGGDIKGRMNLRQKRHMIRFASNSSKLQRHSSRMSPKAPFR